MERRIGTVSRGLRGPIIKEGDDLKTIVVDTLMACIENGDFEIGSKDAVSYTHLRAHETGRNLVCRLLLEKKKKQNKNKKKKKT